MYAQNVLEGHGLVYNPDDGPVEGYSNFLSIWIDAGILGLVRAAGADRLWVFAIGKLLSLAWAIALVIVAFTVLARRSGTHRVALVAGMTFLTFAGPLALWSFSALETTLFALIIAVLVSALLNIDRSDTRNDRLILLAIVAALLSRIDGFVWAGALVTPFVFGLSAARRREVIARVVLPAAAAFVAYNAWRVWYFKELLPMPLYAKVLYKLGSRQTLIANEPANAYVIAFFRAHHWIPAVALALGFAGAYYRSREIRALGVGTGLLLAYLWIVGDWMFGFRFFVPLLAPMAILAAAGFADIARWRPRLAAVAAVIWTIVLGAAAYGFERAYEDDRGRQSWLVSPSLDPARFFAPYYQIYLQAREHVAPGDTIAYNQAGYVPFLLNARNVDDLGICTKFYAKLPTTDVVFTEVGRYSPLTSRPVLRASDAYTLARAPRLLLVPRINPRAANRGTVPESVLAGRYQRLFSMPGVVAYVPAGSLESFRHNPRLYQENLAHVSHLRRAWVNGRVLSVSEYRAELRYLYGRRARLVFDDRYVAEFTFADADEDIYELYIADIRSAQASSVVVILQNAAGRAVYRENFETAAGQRRDFRVDLGDGMKAATLSIAIRQDGPGRQAVEIDDLRVQGQTATLKRFLKEQLDLD